MLGLICPSTVGFLAFAAATLLFVALPASVQPRFTIGARSSFRKATPAPATPPVQTYVF